MSHLLVQRLHTQIQNTEYQQTLEENPGYRGHWWLWWLWRSWPGICHDIYHHHPETDTQHWWSGTDWFMRKSYHLWTSCGLHCYKINAFTKDQRKQARLSQRTEGFHTVESVVHLCNHSDKMSPGELVVQRFSGSDAQNSTVTVDGELSAGRRLQTKWQLMKICFLKYITHLSNTKPKWQTLQEAICSKIWHINLSDGK